MSHPNNDADAKAPEPVEPVEPDAAVDEKPSEIIKEEAAKTAAAEPAAQEPDASADEEQQAVIETFPVVESAAYLEDHEGDGLVEDGDAEADDAIVVDAGPDSAAKAEQSEPDQSEANEQPSADQAAAADAPASAQVVDAPSVRPKPAEKKMAAPPVQSLAQARGIIEALLFTTLEPLSLKRLSALLEPLAAKEIRGVILELQEEYDRRNGGLQLLEVAGGFQLATRAAYGDWVLLLHRHRKRPTLSPAALETLAIIAYKQPITRAEIESVRGVDSSSIARMLEEIEFVKVVGHKEIVGRPRLYGTTKKFLKAFGLSSLNDLPSIAELKTEPDKPAE